MNQVNFTFVYPNKDELQCSANRGDTLLDVALANGIEMDTKIKRTCLVQIQTGREVSLNDFLPGASHDSSNSIDLGIAKIIMDEHGLNSIHEPTSDETNELTPKQLDECFRYAHTYTVDSSLENALVFVNLVRVIYRDKTGADHSMCAYAGETMLSLRERKSKIIDLSFSCHGALACSTCHCVFDVDNPTFESLGIISNDEEDLMYYCNPEEHSRLGCQITLRPDLDLIHIRNPKAKKG